MMITIARMALSMRQEAIATEFLTRSGKYVYVFDPSSGFMRPRMFDGSFLEELTRWTRTRKAS